LLLLLLNLSLWLAAARAPFKPTPPRAGRDEKGACHTDNWSADKYKATLQSSNLKSPEIKVKKVSLSSVWHHVRLTYEI
jgi:hypothetical protein